MWKGEHDKLFCSQSTVHQPSSQRSGPFDETCCHWESVGGVSLKHIICRHAHTVDTHMHTWKHTASHYSFWHPRPGDNCETVCKVFVCLCVCVCVLVWMQGFVYSINLPPGCVSVCFCTRLLAWVFVCVGREDSQTHGRCVSRSQKHLSPSVCVGGLPCWRVHSSPQHLSLGVDGLSSYSYHLHSNWSSFPGKLIQKENYYFCLIACLKFLLNLFQPSHLNLHPIIFYSNAFFVLQVGEKSI